MDKKNPWINVGLDSKSNIDTIYSNINPTPDYVTRIEKTMRPKYSNLTMSVEDILAAPLKVLDNHR